MGIAHENISITNEGTAKNLREETDIQRARKLLGEADRVLIGAGAGLSTAAGLTYAGPRFEKYFAPFIQRYGMTDMYSAGFYPFPTQEDKWAYWAQHIWVNRIEPGATPLYRSLFQWARERDYFVITTNVDAQFELAGFDTDRIFAAQGDYGFIQCASGCHQRIYDARQLVGEWRADTNAIGRNGMGESRPDEPTLTRLTNPSLVPHCPVCGGAMETHLRADGHFVEDDAWHAAQQRYETFAKGILEKKTVLLELGVGWNTPVWIRYPFEHIAQMLGSKRAPLVRMNFDAETADASHMEGSVGLQGDIATLWRELLPDPPRE